MYSANINFKFKVGSVVEVKDGSPIPAGKYVVHLITTSICSPDMVETNDKGYFLESLVNHERDWCVYEDDEYFELVQDTGEEADLYAVRYLDKELGTERRDCVFVLKTDELTPEYFNKRIEAECSYNENGFFRHEVEAKSWELIKHV